MNSISIYEKFWEDMNDIGEKKLSVMNCTTSEGIAVVFSSLSIWANESKLAEFFLSFLFFFFFLSLARAEGRERKWDARECWEKEYSVNFRWICLMKRKRKKRKESEADKGNKHTQETEKQPVKSVWWRTEDKKFKNKFSTLEIIFVHNQKKSISHSIPIALRRRLDVPFLSLSFDLFLDVTFAHLSFKYTHKYRTYIDTLE